MAAMKIQKSWEDSLVMRLKQREGAAMEEFAQTYRARLRPIALTILRSADDADDVVEETLLKAYQAIAQYRHTASLLTWLVSIAKNESLLVIRKRKVQPLSLDYQPVREAAELQDAARHRQLTPEQIMIRKELAGMCHKCVGSLLPGTRTVVVMRLMEDQDNTEIARRLNISTNAVKIRYHRGLQQLKRLVRMKLDRPSPLEAGQTFKSSIPLILRSPSIPVNRGENAGSPRSNGA